MATGEPLYVIDLDAASATVLVGPKEALATKQITLRDVNWIGDGALTDIGSDGCDIFVRVRSTRPPRSAHLSVENGVATITLAEGEDGIAPGQACVFYESDDQRARVLGGGWIKQAEKPYRASEIAKVVSANLSDASENRSIAAG